MEQVDTVPVARKRMHSGVSRKAGGGLTRKAAGRTLPGMSDDFPRAPSQEAWDAMNPEERERVVASLPGEVTDAELSPPEGDVHYLAKEGAREALRNHFSEGHRRVYLAAELPVYYPDAPRFAPDLLAVLDADPHVRDKWVVPDEGKGLDFVLEVHVGGDRKKDTKRNVERYARLGIPEYFVYDGRKHRLEGWRLPTREARQYLRMVPQGGGYTSEQLKLELRVEQQRLRFYANGVLLLEYEELVRYLRQENQHLRQESQQLRQRAEKAEQERDEALRQLAEERRRREAEPLRGPSRRS